VAERLEGRSLADGVRQPTVRPFVDPLRHDVDVIAGAAKRPGQLERHALDPADRGPETPGDEDDPHLLASFRLVGIDRHLRSGPQMLQYRAIARRIALEQQGPVLDWGTGFGQVAKLLADEGADVTPFEFRPDAPAGVRPLERYPELSAHSSPDPVELPFADASFDAVLSCGVLEHVRDPDGSLEEIRRVLRSGGMFYLYNLPNRWAYTERIARLLGLYYHGKLRDDRVYTLRSARELLDRHGFEVRELRRAHMLPLVLGGPSRLVWRLSSALERVPGFNVVATTIEGVAVSRR
jgi:SAM-dependent methyltransferase